MGGDQEEGIVELKETSSESKDEIKEKKKKLSTAKQLKVQKSGVCYLSRIPPHLKPLKLRHMLSQFGEVLRIYLVPEDPAARIRRKRLKVDSGRNFTEGWVEFAKRRDAKRVASMLNGEPMGGKKRSAYYYDLWNIKYLRKFKWDNLTEEIAYKTAVREQKLAAEISAAKRERDFYLARVDQGRAIKAIEERKKKRKVSTIDNDNVGTAGETEKMVRFFHQRKSVSNPSAEMAPTLGREVLAKVFAR